jgi:hypothetical protein
MEAIVKLFQDKDKPESGSTAFLWIPHICKKQEFSATNAIKSDLRTALQLKQC